MLKTASLEKESPAIWKKFFVAGFILMLALVSIGASSNRTASKGNGPTAVQIQNAYADSFAAEKSMDYDAAISALDPVISAFPDSYTPNLRLGWLNYLNKNYDESEKYYENAMKASPDAIEPKVGETLPLLAEQKYAEVVVLTTNVIKTDYYNYTANLRYAFAQRMLKKYDDAIEVSGKMLALYPTDVSFMLELGLAKYANGDKDDATAIMWNALILSPDNETAKAYFGK